MNARAGLAPLALVAALISPPAASADWSLAATVGQRVEANTNRRLDPESQGAIYGSTTSIDLDLGADTPRTTLALSAGVDASIFGGPGDTSGFNGFDPRASALIEYQGPRHSLGANVSFVAQPTSTAQFEESGVTQDDSTQFTVRSGANFGYALDPRTDATFGLTSRIVRFSGETSRDLSPSEQVGLTGGISRDLDPRTAIDFSLGVRRFHSEGDTRETTSRILDLTTRLTRLFSPRLTGRFGVGGTLVDSEERLLAIGTLDDDVNLGATGDLSLVYEMPRTVLSFGGSQGVEPGDEGDIETRSRIFATVTHELNSRASLGLRTSFTRRSETTTVDDDTETRTSVLVGPMFRYALTEDADMSVGYNFRLNDDDDGLATSHAVYLAVTRRFTLLP